MKNILAVAFCVLAGCAANRSEHKGVPDFKFGLLVGNSMKTLDVRENQWLVYKVVAD